MTTHTFPLTAPPQKRIEGVPRLILAGILALGAALATMADGSPGGACIRATADPPQGGTVTVSAPGACPAAGSNVTFTAVPASGYTFAFWSESVQGTANPVSAAMPAASASDSSGASLEVEAHFAQGGTTFDDVAQLDGPQDGSEVEGTVDFQVHDSSSDTVSEADFYLDGQLRKADTQSPYDFSFDAGQLADGRHRVDVQVRDSAGRVVAKTVELVVAAAPAVAWARIVDEGGVHVLRVGGSGFGAGSRISVNGMPVKTKFNARKSILVASGGRRFDEMFPSQTSVCLAVTNPDGQSSGCYSFTRP